MPNSSEEQEKPSEEQKQATEEQEQPALSGLRATEIALSDPLRAETRKARLYLLGVSMVAITIVYTGLAPQEISTLGITFGEADQTSLLGILAFVIFYFLAAFVIYGVNDFLVWSSAYSSVHRAELREEAQRKWTEASKNATELLELEEARKAKQKSHKTLEEQEEQKRHMRKMLDRIGELADAYARTGLLEAWYKVQTLDERTKKVRSEFATVSSVVRLVRGLFEFLLPLLVGLYAIYVLLSA